jgi:hypothetical protein
VAATCRCPICGKKNAGKSRNGKFHRECKMIRDENGSSDSYGFDRDRERRLERRRAKQKFNRNIQKSWMNWDDNEDWEAV